MKQKRLKICNEDDINKVIKYELDRGYNRHTNEQSVKRCYAVECEYSLTTTENDTIDVEAFSEDAAKTLAYDEISRWNDIDDFEVIDIIEGNEAC